MKKKAQTRRPATAARRVVLTPEQQMEKKIWDTLKVSAIREGFGIRKAVEYDVFKGEFFSRKGEHAGKSFIRRIAQKPQTARRIIKGAWSRYRESKSIMQRVQRAVDNPKVSMQKLTELIVEGLYKSDTGAVDYIFDGNTYLNTVKRNLKPGSSGRLRKELINSMMPSNGLDNVISFDRHSLLFLAHELGGKSSHPSADSFRDYDWKWYRGNYVALKKRAQILKVTEKAQKQDIERVRKKYGIKSFKDALNALKELHRETMVRKVNRQKVVDDLVKNAKPGRENVVRALTHFAGESFALDEAHHLLHSTLVYSLVLGAEKRNVQLQQVFGNFIQEATKERK